MQRAKKWMLMNSLRVIEMIKVVNKYQHEVTEKDIYIGRGSPLGNPFVGSKDVEKTKGEVQCESRDEAILQFDKYLNDMVEMKDEQICNELNRIWTMAKKGDVVLVCYCKPKNCHGDMIRNLIEGEL